MYHNFESFVLRAPMLSHTDWLCEKYINEKVCVRVCGFFTSNEKKTSEKKIRERKTTNSEMFEWKHKRLILWLFILIGAIDYSGKKENSVCGFRFEKKDQQKKRTQNHSITSYLNQRNDESFFHLFDSRIQSKQKKSSSETKKKDY